MSGILYLNKEDEVFEWRVEVGLLLQLHDGVKVLVVDVGVDPEQTLQNGLCHRHKITLKGHALGTKEREGSWLEKTPDSSTCSYIIVCLWKWSSLHRQATAWSRGSSSSHESNTATPHVHSIYLQCRKFASFNTKLNCCRSQRLLQRASYRTSQHLDEDTSTSKLKLQMLNNWMHAYWALNWF